MTRPAPKSSERRVWCNHPVKHIEAEARASGYYVRDLSGGDLDAWLPVDTPPPLTCPFCWQGHAPGRPHVADSPLYQMRFHIAYGRGPTAADALAHCAPKVRQSERRRLLAAGLWLLPPAGVPLVAESFVPAGKRKRSVAGRTDHTHRGGAQL